MRRLLGALTLLLTLALPALAGGPLIIVGGGGTPDRVVTRTLALAGGNGARVVILPQASERKDRGESTVRMFRDAGATRVKNLDLRRPKTARKEILAADLLWMSGGSQERLMVALQEANLVDAVREAHGRGAVVGGTSAGAAVQSLLMITGEADLESVTRARTEVKDGLGLWRGVLIDQHFLKRRRNNRLLAAVLDRPANLGIGIDERTAVVVEGGSFEVLGEGSVMVFDARAAVVAESEQGEAHAATGVRLHLLTEGMTFRVEE